MKETDRITVIIPAYNAEQYIRKCVDSILGQTWENLRLILVDDGSTDKTSQIADEYAVRDSRVSVIHKLNEGAELARKAALDVIDSQGFIMFVDADDYLLKRDLLQQLVETSIAESADIVCFDFLHKGKRGLNIVKAETLDVQEALGNMLLRHKIDGNLVCKLYRASIVKAQNVHFVNKRNCDFVIVGTMLTNAGKIYLLPVCGYYYRYVENSQSRNQCLHDREEQYEQEAYRFYEKTALAYPKLKSYAEAHWLSVLIYVCIKMEKDSSVRRSTARFLNYKKHFRKQWAQVIVNPHVTARDKIQYWLCFLNLFRSLFRLKIICGRAVEGRTRQRRV